MGVAGIDMRSVVRLFSLPAGSVVVLRPVGPGQFVNGRWEEPARTRISLTYASVQDIGGEERDQLPEAVRTKDVLQFFLIDDVRPLSRQGQTPADLLEYAGRQWEPVSDANWNANANYWDVVCARVGQ
jgi:hypothetical protein